MRKVFLILLLALSLCLLAACDSESASVLNVETTTPTATPTPTLAPTLTPKRTPTSSITSVTTVTPIPNLTSKTSTSVPLPTSSPIQNPTVTPMPEPTQIQIPEPTLPPLSKPMLTSELTPEPTSLPVVEPAPFLTDEPVPMSTIAPTSEPPQEPTPSEAPSSGIVLISLTSPVSRNESATLKIKGAPDMVYKINVYYSSGASTAAGLSPIISDMDGYASWTWKVGGKTNPGSFRITIAQNDAVVLETYFTVK